MANLIVTDDKGHRSTIHTTANHPFWNTGASQWQAAGQLRPGDRLQSIDAVTIEVIAVVEYPASRHMLNLTVTVTDTRTYYVLARATPVLVHNSNCGIGRELIGDQVSDHILDGHRFPGISGKDPFPRDWSDDKILDSVADVVTSPTSQRTWYKGSAVHAERTLKTRKGEPAVQNVIRTVDGVNILVRYEPLTGKVLTAFPQ